jgi:hypothetical protein
MNETIYTLWKPHAAEDDEADWIADFWEDELETSGYVNISSEQLIQLRSEVFPETQQ